jgi:DNA topoisomerase VI subunit B
MPPGPYLKLTVQDNGHGMTSRVLARIFDPYFTTEWKSNGTGLGLSVVYGIVKSHGGIIVCTSTPKEGTAFDIYLPEIQSSTGVAEPLLEISFTSEDKRILFLDGDKPARKALGAGAVYSNSKNKHG